MSFHVALLLLYYLFHFVGDVIRSDDKDEYVFRFKIKDLKKKDPKSGVGAKANSAR